MRHLIIVVPLALLIILGLLYIMFGGLRHAILIFGILPYALSGGIFLLYVRGLYLSVSASIGFVALFGVAVLNGIVLVAHLNELREKGRSLADAVVQGAGDRLRPVLMTALVASLGFVPMAFNTGPGSEVQRPLATVVIGGLADLDTGDIAGSTPGIRVGGKALRGTGSRACRRGFLTGKGSPSGAAPFIWAHS